MTSATSAIFVMKPKHSTNDSNRYSLCNLPSSSCHPLAEASLCVISSVESALSDMTREYSTRGCGSLEQREQIVSCDRRGGRRASECAFREVPLSFLQVEDALFHRVQCDQAVDVDG